MERERERERERDRERASERERRRERKREGGGTDRDEVAGRGKLMLQQHRPHLVFRLGFTLQYVEFRVKGLGLRVQGVGFSV